MMKPKLDTAWGSLEGGVRMLRTLPLVSALSPVAVTSPVLSQVEPIV